MAARNTADHTGSIHTARNTDPQQQPAAVQGTERAKQNRASIRFILSGERDGRYRTGKIGKLSGLLKAICTKCLQFCTFR